MKHRIDTLLEKVLIFILSIMLISVVWQVFSRYILQSPSTITDEISSFLLIWLGLLGSAYATGQKLHLAIDLIPKAAIKKRKRLFNSIVYGSVIVFAFSVMVIGGFRLCFLSFQFEQTSAALKIPLGIIYIIVPTAGLLICYYSLHLFYTNNLKEVTSV